MPDYRRAWHPGGTWFFTVNAMVCKDNDLLIRNIDLLRDTDFLTRWRLIKAGSSKGLPATERRSEVRMARRERGIWQRRYWEHLIRDERDDRAHLDDLHLNPVKHGHVRRVADWPFLDVSRLGRA